MSKILYIIRGAPGSGKSTLAHKLTDNVVEADQFLYVNGKYEWAGYKLRMAHRKCFQTVEDYMIEGRDKIAVANTFIKRKEVQPYLDLAKEYGYEVVQKVCKGNYKNIHNVPEETVEKMRSKFQESVEDHTDMDINDYYYDGELDETFNYDKSIIIKMNESSNFDGKETINIDGNERPIYNSLGNPIAETEESLRNFYRWFGNSKVVDDKGRPLVVYHGTEKMFNTFDKKETRSKGFFFATEQRKDVAEYYAGDKGRILPVYLSLKKPKIGSPEEVHGMSEDGIHDGYISIAEQNWDNLKKGDIVEIVVFEPNQIKSVKNIGTWSIESNNINENVINEEIVYADSHDDNLGNVILKNPTRNELRQNNMIYCRVVNDDSGNAYFANAYDYSHAGIVDTLIDNGADDFDYSRESYDYGFNVILYDYKTNTFFYRTEWFSENEYNETLQEFTTLINAMVSNESFGDYNCRLTSDEEPWKD